ncbi:hypothetical protein ACIHFE_06815 [Streptomyces sp. NPDC052396]|uniref:hypothetical protein n=1 Tax=Streptomyces sp. NPDC052396 TaxID=3365689 RepID=UPI0037D35B62
MRVRRFNSTLAAAGVALLLAISTPAAHADGRSKLPITGDLPQGEMVVDGVHHQVFISDPKTSSVVVTDYNGRLLKRITSETSANGLALSPDSGTLYVALTEVDSISLIDTATLQEKDRHDTGVSPKYLAFTGGKLWFSYEAHVQGNLGSMAPTGPWPKVSLDQADGVAWDHAPRLTTAPAADRGLLVAQGDDYERRERAVYDVSSGAARQRAHRKETTGGRLFNALSPDGKEIAATDGDDGLTALRASDLTPSGTTRKLAGKEELRSVAFAPDGALAVGSAHGAQVFRPGDREPVRKYSVGDGDWVQPRGLAWAPDGSKLFVLTTGSFDNDLVLRTIDGPARQNTQLRLGVSGKASLDRKLALRGSIGTSFNGWSEEVRVELIRTDAASPKGKSLGVRTVRPGLLDRGFDLADVPRVGGKVTYTLRFAGDRTHAPASDSVTVDVPRNKTTLALTAGAKAVPAGKNVTLTAKLGKTAQERTVSVYAQPAGGAKKLVRAAKVDRDGKLVVSYKVTKNTTFTAVFAGDSRTEPVRATAVVKRG